MQYYYLKTFSLKVFSIKAFFMFILKSLANLYYYINYNFIKKIKHFSLLYHHHNYIKKINSVL